MYGAVDVLFINVINLCVIGVQAKDIVASTTGILLEVKIKPSRHAVIYKRHFNVLYFEQAPNWMTNGNKSSDRQGEPGKGEASGILADEDDLYDLEGVINYSSSIGHAVETFVEYISSIVTKYESPLTGPLPHADLLVPLGAIKVILDAAMQKVLIGLSLLNHVTTHSLGDVLLILCL